MKRYKYNRENRISSVIPFRCRSCSEEHCEDERSRKRQKKATAAGLESGPVGQEPTPAGSTSESASPVEAGEPASAKGGRLNTNWCRLEDDAKVDLVLQSFEEVWSKLKKWIPKTGPLKGIEVASVNSFLPIAGFGPKCDAHTAVRRWKSGGIASIGNTSFRLVKMPFRRCGKVWAASEQTLQVIYLYLRHR